MPFKPVIKWAHRIVTIILLIVVTTFLVINMQDGRQQDEKLLIARQLDTQSWLYVTEYGNGGATVPFIYRYYLVGNLQGNREPQLKQYTPFLEAANASAEVTTEGETITVRYRGKVYSFGNSVVYQSNGRLITPHLNFQAQN